MEAAVQLAEQDGQEAVCCQHTSVPCALVIDHHVLWFCGLHLGDMRAEVKELQAPVRLPMICCCLLPLAQGKSRVSGGRGCCHPAAWEDRCPATDLTYSTCPGAQVCSPGQV